MKGKKATLTKTCVVEKTVSYFSSKLPRRVSYPPCLSYFTATSTLTLLLPTSKIICHCSIQWMLFSSDLVDSVQCVCPCCLPPFLKLHHTSLSWLSSYHPTLLFMGLHGSPLTVSVPIALPSAHCSSRSTFEAIN